MAKKPKRTSTQPSELRRRAEELLRTTPSDVSAMPIENLQALVHELQVHQVELELQNEELQRAQVDLQEARDRYSALYELAPVGYLTLDREGIIREANLAAANLLGVDRRNLVARNLASFLAAEARDVVYLHLRKVFAGDTLQTCEALFSRCGGDTLDIQLDSVNALDLDSLQCRTVLTDISERTRAANAVREARLYAEAIVKTVRAGLIVLDGDLRVKSCNPSFCRTFRVTEQETEGRPLEELGNRQWDIPELRALLEDVLSKNAHVVDYEVTREFGHLGVRTMAIDARPIAADGGRRKGILLSVEDVTERKRAGDELQRMNEVLRQGVAERTGALRRTEQEFRALADNVPAFFSFVGADRRYRYVNRRYEELFGLPAEEIVGKTVEGLLDEAGNEVARSHIETVLNGQGVSYEIRLTTPRDGIHWMYVNYVPQLDEAGRVDGFLTLATDITERKRHEERLLQSERLAAIGETVTGLAHESRNALQRSQAAIERLARRLRRDPEALEIVGQVQRAQDDLHRRYEDVREYAGPIRLTKETCDLGRIVEEAWEDLSLARQGREARLQQDAGNLDLHWAVDRSYFQQVVRNILENSIEATTEAVEIRVRYSTGQIDDEPAIRMAIRDNGPGLSSEIKGRIFDAFYTTKNRGTGLGMAITRRIVEAHGGQIAVSGAAGSGTEIVVTLPRRTGDAEAVTASRRR